jgi:hypothetical protein
MTTFEEDLNRRMDLKEVPMYFTQSGCSMTRKTYIETNWVFDTYKNWHSDEEFQDKEKEIKRLRKINHLYKKAKGNAERMAVDRGERLNQAQDEITSLESQLQQQAKQVVPEFVGEWIEHCKGMGYSLIGALTFKLSSTMHEELSAKILKWLEKEGNDETFTLAFITGEYEVEKPQKFYLKNKLTGLYLYKKPLGGYGEEFATPIKVLTKDFKFTQTEIDGMNAQGYDKEDEYKGE